MTGLLLPLHGGSPEPNPEPILGSMHGKQSGVCSDGTTPAHSCEKIPVKEEVHWFPTMAANKILWQPLSCPSCIQWCSRVSGTEFCLHNGTSPSSPLPFSSMLWKIDNTRDCRGSPIVQAELCSHDVGFNPLPPLRAAATLWHMWKIQKPLNHPAYLGS